ncbi:HAD-IA family hydrolase [Alkalicoccus urumqiensis]|uniref:Beta-phosphoglucomutase n=1 Tax=Alkalicoccus urumqiensis TaxID=1548213 RepID=A0A2P6MKZ3_ALKUR|nr:HAD-IA family hydrolase [Alkalicoccus urumqiensis]PRO66957.1 beta-phosphoglucomutase [Alkalicoccus urumqiensis]
MHAVLFDLDGVLTNTVPLHYAASKKAASLAGVPFSKADNERWQGRSRKELMEFLIAENPDTPWTAEELGEIKNKRYQELIQELSAADILPGMKELLQTLNDRDIPCVLCSSSSNALEVIEKLKLKDHFHAVIPAADTKAMKPHPDIFLKGAEAVSCRPENSVGIEDSISGVEALKRAGIPSIGVGSGGREADVSVKRTKDVTIGLICDFWKK